MGSTPEEEGKGDDGEGDPQAGGGAQVGGGVPGCADAETYEGERGEQAPEQGEHGGVSGQLS
jgi:hypothetical protein